MRSFTCFTFVKPDAAPIKSFILAADVSRARALAQRELVRALRPAAVEIHERGKLVWREAG